MSAGYGQLRRRGERGSGDVCMNIEENLAEGIHQWPLPSRSHVAALVSALATKYGGRVRQQSLPIALKHVRLTVPV